MLGLLIDWLFIFCDCVYDFLNWYGDVIFVLFCVRIDYLE